MAKVVLVFSAIAFVVVQAAEVPDKIKETGKIARATCIEKTRVTKEMIENTLKGDFTDDNKFRCYFKCTLEHLQLLENEDINYDMILDLLPEASKNKTANTIEICEELITGLDLCEKSNNFFKCFYRYSPEDYFVV